jgi:hypothetical protein
LQSSAEEVGEKKKDLVPSYGKRRYRWTVYRAEARERDDEVRSTRLNWEDGVVGDRFVDVRTEREVVKKH